MSKLYLTILVCCTVGSIALAQQLPRYSPLANNAFIWNPAMTAPELEWEAGATHRQEWLGFEHAPVTTSAYGQYAMPKNPVSIGGFLMLDQVAPIQQNTLGMSYVYKLGRTRRQRRGRFRKRTTGQLSLGIMATLNHVLYNPTELNVNDGDDPLAITVERSAFQPNFGAGLYYRTRPSGPTEKSYGYLGVGANQFLASDLRFVDLEQTANLRRAFHGNATLGYRAAGKQFVFEPMLWLSFTEASITDLQVSIQAELPDVCWAGLVYGLNQSLSFQLGYLADRTDAGQLRIGAQGTFNLGGLGSERGPGFEVYVAYRGGRS